MSASPRPQLRRTPRQARARQTLEHILLVAAALIEEVGVEGFNTNLLAERADVRISTVYRYSPNRVSVLAELARRSAEAWDGWFDDGAPADPANPLREVWAGYIRAFVEGVRAMPGGLAIRAALHSLPELQTLEADDTRRLAARLARALCQRAPDLDPRRARVAARLLLETAISALDAALSGRAKPQRGVLSELVEMQVAYLEQLLAPKTRRIR